MTCICKIFSGKICHFVASWFSTGERHSCFITFFLHFSVAAKSTITTYIHMYSTVIIMSTCDFFYESINLLPFPLTIRIWLFAFTILDIYACKHAIHGVILTCKKYTSMKIIIFKVVFFFVINSSNDKLLLVSISHTFKQF